MSSRMARYDDRNSRRGASPVKRRRFTEVPESRDRRSPRAISRHRESDRTGHARRHERSRSRSPVGRRDRDEPPQRSERRYRETPPREKRKFREERENEPRKRRRSPTPVRATGTDGEVVPVAIVIDDNKEEEEDAEEGGGGRLPARRFDQTEFTLDDRFSALSTSRAPVVEENVSVEIERKIPGREGFRIPVALEPRAVAVPRGASDRRPPLTSREEFKGRGGTFPVERPDERFASGGRSMEKRVIRPGDVARGGAVLPFRDRRGREDWNGSPTKDAKYNDLHTGRQRGHEDDGSSLPDFSKRPGKYSYDVWRDKPELIPKGKSYFEHDVRNYEEREERRSREARGGFWTRGRAPRGRGYSRPAEAHHLGSRSDMDVWRHDKFEELLAEESQEAT